MTDEPTTPPEGTTDTKPPEEDQRVPYERFQQANKKAKDAADRAKALETQMDELRQQMEERESAGLPELERMKKDLERASKRADEAEARATEQEQNVLKVQKQQWITAAASAQNFLDPSDASAFLDLSEIDDVKDAERAVKRLAGSKKHLVKPDDPKLPGRVLENGRTPVPASPAGGIDENAEASTILEGLKPFLNQWKSV